MSEIKNIFKKPLNLLGLVAINVIAIDSLRTLPISAEYGLAAVFYYLLAAIILFFPVALISAELATGWPETGGIYVWVREAFGKKIGFVTIWLQWFYNICWYPTIMSIVAAAIAYVFHPNIVNNKTYMLSMIMILFWGATGVNCLGMKASSRFSNFSAIIGTLVPMAFIMVLGVIWVALGKPSQLHVSVRHFFPNLTQWNNLVFFVGILYGLIGMEMSAAHAGEVQNPQRDYPKAILYSIILILFTLIFGSLAISIVVPAHQLNIVSGVLQAFVLFFQAFHMTWFMPILAIFIVFGAMGNAAAWMLGPSKGMLVASQDGSLPAALGKLSARGAPVNMLLLQGVIFTLLCSAFFILMPSVSGAFWALTDVSAVLAFVVYVVMFPAAIILRYRFPNQPRAFRVPGGNVGIWVISLLGLITCFFAIAIGFIPPPSAQIPVGNIVIYELILVSGVVLGCIAPLLFIVIMGRRTKNNLEIKRRIS